MDNVYTYFVTMPPNVHEYVAPCIDGYTVYIDEKLDADRRVQAYNHALGHIQNGDFNKVFADEIEKIAHSGVDQG